MQARIYRNTCPRNCYGTCGILSHVVDGKLMKVTGDPKHGYNNGSLCAKGYAYTQFVYHPNRLKYPMRQSSRGSGKWNRISWNEAYSIIANKILELNERYGSNLPIAYNKFSGNLGMLHYATEGMFNSLGPHTKPVGNPCALTGKQAITNSFGHNFSSNPEDMANAKLIVIWGSNPAVTNVHQMKFIFQARRNGAKLIVIDPVYTQTAKKADLYIQIKPGTDSWLALGIAKLLVESGNYDEKFLTSQAIGWEDYKSFLKDDLTLEDVTRHTGVSWDAIIELSHIYTSKPAVTWNGLGMQRSERGIHSMEAINSLAAITGNLTTPNGGLYFMHFDIERFPLTLKNHQGPVHPTVHNCREIDISNFAENALAFSEPPLKMLWVASRNIVSQDQNLKAWEQLFKQLDLIVTVDLFLTKTAEQSDIVLPAATHFEEEDLNVGYWHYYLSYNQKAIPAYYEAKSDLQIARELTSKLNQLSPGFSNFPADKEPLDWIKAELTPDILDLYAIHGVEDLIDAPHLKQQSNTVLTEEQQFQLFAPRTFMESVQQMDSQETSVEKDGTMYQLLSPQSLLKIHSQYEMLSWLSEDESEARIEIPSEAAFQHGIPNNTKIEVFNEHGSIIGLAKINSQLPNNVIVAPQAGHNPINQLILHDNKNCANESSTFFYDSLVRIRKRSEPHV